MTKKEALKRIEKVVSENNIKKIEDEYGHDYVYCHVVGQIKGILGCLDFTAGDDKK